MAEYKYTDVVNALIVAGYEPIKNNGGSHQAFINKYTGLKQVVPRHSNGKVAGGTAESILDQATLSALILNINIGTEKSGLSKDVVNYIRKQHTHIKEDPMSMVPDDTRMVCGLDDPKKVHDFIQEKINIGRRQYNRARNGNIA